MHPIVIIPLCFTIGYFVQKRYSLPSSFIFGINKFIINISLPCIILLSVPHLQLDFKAMMPAVYAWIAMLSACIFVWLAYRIFNWSRDTLAALLLTAVLGNTSFIGYPLVQFAYGETGLTQAIFYDQFGSFIFLAVCGTAIASGFSATHQTINWAQIILRIVKFPPFIALISALILPILPLIELLEQPLTWLAKLMMPLALFMVGSQFQLKLDAEIKQPLMLGLLIKMILAPMILVLCIYLMGTDDESAKVSVFEAAMPPMITASVLAINANLAPKLATAMVGMGILFSLLTLPIFYLFS